MEIKTRLSPKVSARLALTPAMRQGLNVLRLSPLDLVERLRQEAEANPLLLVEDAPGGAALEAMVAAAPAVADGLEVSLRKQLALMDLAPRVAAAAAGLTERLDERGYLPKSRAEYAVELRCDLETLDAALAALKECEPPGIGARSLAECLVLQLCRIGLVRSRAERAVSALLPLLGGEEGRALSRLGGDAAELEALRGLVRHLDPNPAQRFEAATAQFLLPDLRVERHVDGALEVALVDRWMPRLSVDEGLWALSRGDDEGRAFVDDRREAAEALIRAVRYRQSTLLRVGQAAVAAQAEYFRGRMPHPRPLTRAEIAASLGYHGSTVGRVLQGRAYEFEGAVHPLARLFPAAGPSQGDASLSGAALGDRIAGMIAEETPGAPLSDLEIAQRLHEEGVDIARRTVAKYRGCLNIPSSHIRRRVAFRPKSRGTARL